MLRLVLKGMAGVALAAAAWSAPATAADVPVVTGTEWTAASQDQKLAFLVGIANIVAVEYHLTKDDPTPDPDSMIVTIVERANASDLTLTEIAAAVDAYYAAHADRMSESVIEVLWLEIVDGDSVK